MANERNLRAGGAQMLNERWRARAARVVLAGVVACGSLTFAGTDGAGAQEAHVTNVNAACGTWVLQQAGSATELQGFATQISNALALPGVVGLSLRVPWDALEADPTLLDQGLAMAQARGKAFAIRFMAGRWTPDHVFQDGAHSFVSAAGDVTPVPFAPDGTPGNPVFEQAFDQEVGVLAAWSRAHGVRVLHLPWYGFLWAEIYNGPEMEALPGYSYETWLEGHRRLAAIALSHAGDDLAVEFPLSGHWGAHPQGGNDVADDLVELAGPSSPRVIVQGNGMGRFSNRTTDRPLLHAKQMYDGMDYDWASIYATLTANAERYLEVYTASFNRPNKAILAAQAASFGAACDAQAPTATLTGPADGTVVAGSVPVTATGSDDRAGATLEVLVDGVVVGTTSATSINAPWDTTTVADGLHEVVARVTDAAGNRTTSDAATVRVQNDVTAPGSVLSSPTEGQTFPATPIAVAGDASDIGGVAAVELAISDVATGAWWNGTGWQAGATHVQATLASPGAATTTWAYSFAPPARGTFHVVVTAVDAAGNAQVAGPSATFGYVDAAAPTGTVSAPTSGAVLNSTPISVAGSAADDVGVTGVALAITDASTGSSWNGTAWQSTATTVPAVLASPGATTTGWSYLFSPPAPGAYQVVATARDAAGNTDPAAPSSAFTLNAAPTVTARTPAAEATGVAVGSDVTATFSEAVSGVSTTTFQLRLATGGSALAATVTRNGTTNEWILNPSGSLQAGTRYTATLTGGTTAIRDSAGAALTTTSWSFTTAAPVNAPPTVTSRSPGIDATGVSTTSNVTATFSEAVSGVSTTTFQLRLATGGSALAATVTRNGTTNQWILNPSSTLQAGTRYTATLTGGTTAIRDSAGAALTTTSWSFTTAAPVNAPPTVTSRVPASGATNVSRTANLSATFSEAVSGVSTTTFQLRLASGGSAIAATVTRNGSTNQWILNPSSTLLARTQYRVTLTGGASAIRDTAGAPLTTTSWTFTTGS